MVAGWRCGEVKLEVTCEEELLASTQKMLGIGCHSEHSDYVSNVPSAPMNDYDYMSKRGPDIV